MLFTELPDTALAAILSGFCDGKTISTLALNVVNGRNSGGHRRFWNICRNVLVERYIRLRCRHGGLLSFSTITADRSEEIRDILDITREDIRLSTNDDDDMITKFSHWCAILDYFETQLQLFQVAAATQSQQQQQPNHPAPSSLSSSPSLLLLPRRREPQWIVWRGNMTMPNGEIQCYLTTPFWSVGAMRFWQQMEQENASFCRPSPPNFAFRPPPPPQRSRPTQTSSTDANAAAEQNDTDDDTDDTGDDDDEDSFDNRRQSGVTPYGTLFAIDPVSKRRFAFQCGDLAIDHFDAVRERDHWRHALIPLSQLYDHEATVVLVDHSFVSRTYTDHPVGPLLVGDARSSLCVCWDKEQGEDDWEMAHARLGEMCVQIMNGFPGKTFRDGLLASTDYVQANEFCNF
jgi:hypothetical protein